MQEFSCIHFINNKIFFMNRVQIIKQQFIEVIIPKGTSQRQFNLQDQPDLRFVELVGIESFHYFDGCNFSPNGVKIVNDNLYYNLFLTLQDYTGKIIMQDYLMTLLHRIFKNKDGANPLPRFVLEMLSFTGQKINWPKSHILIGDPSFISVDTDEVVPLIVYYSESAEIEENARKTEFLDRK
jgi:hypothetical protein